MANGQKLIGITPVIRPNFDLLREAGIGWLRVHIGFPYRDAAGGAYSEHFARRLEYVKELVDSGFRILGEIPGPGSYRYDEKAKETRWMGWLPEGAPAEGTDEYYAMIEEMAAETARATKGIVELYQVANEMDIDIFRGPLTDEQTARYMQAGARGLKRGNPDAKPGINLGFWTEMSERMLKQTYAEPDLFDYIGIDGYFGSWQPGGPEDWTRYIEKAHEASGKPVIISEWGYSSLQRSPNAGDKPMDRYNQGVCANKAWDRAWKKEHSPEEQAEFVTACIKIFAEHPHVWGQFFFRYNDTETCWQCGQPDCPAECAWGCVDVQGNPKPAYYALKEAIRSYY